jgi:hypothetical protein
MILHFLGRKLYSQIPVSTFLSVQDKILQRRNSTSEETPLSASLPACGERGNERSVTSWNRLSLVWRNEQDKILQRRNSTSKETPLSGSLPARARGERGNEHSCRLYIETHIHSASQPSAGEELCHAPFSFEQSIRNLP